MARISYVDPGTVTDPELAGYLADAREHGTPRLESQAIRAHVPAVLRTFSQSWQQVFRDGVLDHRVKELARVFIAKSGVRVLRRPALGPRRRPGPCEPAFDEVIDFRQSQLLTARDKAALGWAEAIAWDPALADDDLWSELHRHFTEPELVELGYFIGLTMDSSGSSRPSACATATWAATAWPGSPPTPPPRWPAADPGPDAAGGRRITPSRADHRYRHASPRQPSGKSPADSAGPRSSTDNTA